ncbi:MAG: hypothetical protein PWP52_1648 [Bacteroidales bacterium]|nr:hypothetical protein [Bacteroidales bacterium]MDN5355788.1 hypothetical protein [Rikenellaceae bacterium]
MIYMDETLIIKNSELTDVLPLRSLISFMFYDSGFAYFLLKSGRSLRYSCLASEFIDFNSFR